MKGGETMKNEMTINQEVKLQIINSLNQSREKWFELLKESLENEELREIILNKIDKLDESIISLDQNINPLFFGQTDGLSDRLEDIEERLEDIQKKLKK